MGAFCQSGAQPMEGGGGVAKAVVTGLPRKLSPLLSIPGVGPCVVAGGGLTPDNRTALPSAPSSPAQ